MEWMVLYFHVQVLPRTKEFVDVSPRDFIFCLRSELEEATKSNAWLCFGIMYSGSILQLQYHRPPDLPHFKIKSKFWGFNCNPENERVPTMMGSPFYRSFNSLPPMAATHASPSSGRYYSSD
jgi:hypothetical protein